MSKENEIKVVEKNAGTKIDYEQSGTKIIFGDDELMINAAKYQKDWPVQVDICADEYQNLVIGVGVGRYYVAQVDIPAVEYEETEAEVADPMVADRDDAAEETQPTKQLVAKPLDMADVVLTLWSVDDWKNK